MDTHIQFSNINFFYFALLKTSPEAKLLIIQNRFCMSTAKRYYFKLFSKPESNSASTAIYEFPKYG